MLRVLFRLPFFNLQYSNFKEDYFNITSYEMLSIETPDFVQVNNSLAAMKKAGSGYVKARNIGISVEALIEFNRSTYQFFSGPSLLSSMEMAITNPHGSMKRIMFWYRILIPHDKAGMMLSILGGPKNWHLFSRKIKQIWFPENVLRIGG